LAEIIWIVSVNVIFQCLWSRAKLHRFSLTPKSMTLKDLKMLSRLNCYKIITIQLRGSLSYSYSYAATFMVRPSRFRLVYVTGI